MAHQPINHGSAAGDGQGESLFSAFSKVNANDAELFGAKTVFVANYAALPAVGEIGKIYVTLDDDAMYRWTGTGYDDLGGIQFVANASALPVVGEALKVYIAIDTGVGWWWNGMGYQALGWNAEGTAQVEPLTGKSIFRPVVNRFGTDFERTPGVVLHDIPSATPVGGTGTTPASTSAISSAVQWGGENTLEMTNLQGSSGGTCNFTFNLATPFAAQIEAPPMFFPVYIPDYKTVENVQIVLSMGDTTFANTMSATWAVGPTGHSDKQRNGWHLISIAAADWVAGGTGAWTSTINAVRYRFINRNYPSTSKIFAASPILGRSAVPSLLIYADDAYTSWYEHGLPIFEAYGLKTNIALAKNWVGVGGYMTLAQYLDAQARGHEICVHSTNRVGVQLLTVEDAVADISLNQSYVRDVIGSRWGYKHFVWPNGQYWITDRADMSVVNAVRDQLGMELGRTTDDVLRTTTRTPLGLSNDTATKHNILTIPEIGPWNADSVATIKTAIDLVVSRRHAGTLVFHSTGPSDAYIWQKPHGIEQIAEHIAGHVGDGKLINPTGEEFFTGLAGRRV